MSDKQPIVTPEPGVTPHTLAARAELRSLGRTIGALDLGQYSLSLSRGRDAMWLIVRRPQAGGLALRLAPCLGGVQAVRKRRPRTGDAMRVSVESLDGSYDVAIRLHDGTVPSLRVATTFTPRVPLLIPFVPRDLYPLGDQDDPLAAEGCVEAAQRGLNTAAIFFRMKDPAFGSVLYLQNLTSLNPYFAATGTKPDGVVGGLWPEIGFLLPTPPHHGDPADKPLPAGRPVVVSDVFLALHHDSEGDEREMARRYLVMLGTLLRRIEQPRTEFRDWTNRAERSLADLSGSRKASVRHYGFRYLHPYTAAEYPDSMVQLSVLSAIRDYEAWSGKKAPIGRELSAGLGKFYDPKRKLLRRYLPNVGADKDRYAVDSWYLYHPLMQLGRLALDGDAQARRLFEKSLAFGIKAARHFDYKWPIEYDLRDFTVLQEARDDRGLGQTDVGGVYAYVMLQAFEVLGRKEYLDEARAAIKAARGMRFELNYQANLTAWGAAACMRLWRITGEEAYLQQSYAYLASFFHNAAMWESDIGHARHYRNFLGVSALHDAPYMAMYECFDSFAAFERYLKDSGPELDPAVRLLVCEYCRHALDRAWFYYPDALPEEVIAKEQRENNGHVDRTLSFPVEDLYVDGQEAGQVGQEVYGSGAAFVFASRAFHNVSGAPFRIFCDHFLLASDRPTERTLSFQLAGSEASEANLSMVRTGRARLPAIAVSAWDGQRVRAVRRTPERIEYRVPANGRISLSW